MSNLRYIKEVNGLGATTLSITDVFNADFDIYKIVYFCVNDSGTPQGVSMRLINSSGSVITSSKYNRAIHQLNTNVNFTTNKTADGNNFIDLFGNVRVVPEGANGVMYIFNPFSSSEFTQIIQEGWMNWSGSRAGTKSMGVLEENTSVTGFQAFLPSTNLTTATNIKIYGLSIT